MNRAIYIASPYTIGDVGVNVRNNFLAADALLEMGFIPFPPLFSHFWHILSPKSYDEWIRMDNEWVIRCDCLFRLPGKSKGADEEVQLALSRAIPVYFNIKEIDFKCPECMKQVKAFQSSCVCGFVRPRLFD